VRCARILATLFKSKSVELAMNKVISLALLIGGIVLFIYGLSASDSIASGVSRAFTGSPTDKTIWLLVGGIIASIIGVVGLVRGGTRET
jgi:uncharacterized membrane protein